MSASKLHAAGYTDLVSVIPPAGEISPNSEIDPTQRGKVPGKKGSRGWHGYNFITAPAPGPEAVKAWDAWGANVGLQGRNFPGLDIDCSDRLITQIVEKFAREKLGVAPVRLSRGERRLMVYRTEEPFSRVALIITRGGVSHLVEFLGEGRQYLVHGKHPSGEDYRWQGKPLWQIPPTEIPVVTLAKVNTFFDALSGALASRGVEVERVGSGATDRATPPSEDLMAPSTEALEALPLPPNPPEYGWDEFVKFGYAYYAAGGEDLDLAFDRWDAWAMQHPRYDRAECERQWNKGFRDARVGWSFLQDMAQEGGEYVSAQDDFEADPSMAGQQLPPSPVSVTAAPADDEPGERIRFTDEWVVDRLLPALRKKLCYVPGVGDNGRWLIWRGHKWGADQVQEHELIVRDDLRRLAARLETIADAAPSKDEAKEYRKAARRCQSQGGITGVLRLIRAPLAVAETGFDADPMLLATPTGVVDLRTGEVTAPTPEGRHSRATAIGPAEGDAPRFKRFLDDLTSGDEEFQSWLQKLVGYSLTGQVSEKILAYAWGSSDTGKSQFIHLLRGLMADYADTIDVETFISRGRSSSKGDAEIARLVGARLVTASEPAAGDAWDERRIKTITGGDPISAKFLYGQPFTFLPQFKIVIVGNSEPEIRHVDDAMLRRILILPFNRKVPREQQVENLAAKLLEAEGPQILDWAIRGCLRWQEEGLAPPEAVAAKVRQYAEDQDTVRAFLTEQCDLDGDAQIARDDLFRAWSIWCRTRNENPGKALSFRGLFAPYAEKLGLQEAFVTTNGQRRRGYRGIALRPQVEQGTEDFAA